MNKKQKRNFAILAISVILVVILLASYKVGSNLQVTDLFQQITQQPATSNSPFPTSTQQSNSLAPTSLTLQISPNPVVLKHAVYGAIISDGYNYPVTIHATNLGAQEWSGQGTFTTQAFLGSDGKFQQPVQMNIAGFWQIYATTNTATSATTTLTVNGVSTYATAQTVSKSGNPSIYLLVASSHRNSPVVFTADDPVHSFSIPLQSVNTDENGSVAVMYNFSTFTEGTYLINAIVGGENAVSYNSAYTIQVVA